MEKNDQVVEAAVKALTENKPELAVSLCEDLNTLPSKDDRITLLLGVALRRLNKLDQSEPLLREVIEAKPHIPAAHYELGLALIHQNRFLEAQHSLEQALHLQPDLASAWRALSNVYSTRGEFAKAARARRHTLLCELHANSALAEAIRLFEGGLLRQSEEKCREHLQSQPADPEARRFLAEIGLTLNSVKHSIKLLRQCLTQHESFEAARVDLVLALAKAGQFSEALSEVDLLKDNSPQALSHDVLAASVLFSAGRFEESTEIFSQILRKIPHDPNLLTSYGHALRFGGKGPQAIAAYTMITKSDSDSAEAYFSLANLKTYKFSHQELENIRALSQDPKLSGIDQIRTAFALGKALEDFGHYDDAFAAYSKGNDLKLRSLAYDPSSMRDEIRRITDHTLPPFKTQTGNHSSDPIFVVGLPRAGSTLVEQILASHSQVEATAELPYIGVIAGDLMKELDRQRSGSHLEMLNRLSAAKRTDLGQKYLDLCAKHRVTTTKFIDKQPNNWRHIGLIKAILPNATIIDVRRHPLAVCLANFRQLFAGNAQPFSYRLTHLGHYYADYLKLMTYWGTTFHDGYSVIEYESVVEDFEAQVSKILGYCGLQFEDSCLNYHQTSRHIRTPSSEQVRLPIYHDSLHFWKHYDLHLSGLRATLKDRGLTL